MNNENNLNNGVMPENPSATPSVTPGVTPVSPAPATTIVTPPVDTDMMMAAPATPAPVNPEPAPAPTSAEVLATPAAPVEAVMTQPVPEAPVANETLDAPIAPTVPETPATVGTETPTDPNAPVDPSAVPGGLVIEPAPGAAEIEPFKEEEQTEPKKKKPNKIVLIVLIIALIIILTVGGFVAYQFFGIKPQKVHTKFINEFFNAANTYVTSLNSTPTNPDAKSLLQNGTLTFNTNIEELQMINNYSVKYALGSFANDNSALLNLSLLEKNKGILSLAAYYINNNIYIDSSDLYDKLILVGSGTIDIKSLVESRGITSEDLTHVITLIKNSVLRSLDNNKYDRKLTTVKINGKDTKAFNNSYKFDEASLIAIEKNIVDDLKNDNQALEVLSKMIGLTVDDISLELSEMSKILTDPKIDGTGNVLLFNIYTSVLDNKVLTAKMYNGTEEVFNYMADGAKKTFTLSLDTSSVVFIMENNAGEIRLIEDHNTLLTINYNKESDSKTSTTIVINSANLMGENNIGNVSINIQNETGEKETNQIIKLNVPVEDKNYEFTINNNLTTTYDTNMPNVNIKDAVSYEQIDMETLQANLLKALQGTDLYDLISGSIPEIPELPENPNTPEIPENPGSSTNPENPGGNTLPSDPNENPNQGNEKENPNCKNATCKNCTGSTCTCTYLDDSFTEKTVTCPNPNN